MTKIAFFQRLFSGPVYPLDMLRCAELTSQGLSTYELPFEPDTPQRLHQDRHHISKVVRYETTRVRFPEQEAAFSLKCSFAGPVTYVVDGRRVTVEEDRYMLVNRQRLYASYVQHEAPVRAFSLFFGQPMVDEVVHSLTTPAEELLEATTVPALGEGFFENLQPHDEILHERLRELYRAHLHNQLEPGWLQEKLRQVLAALVHSDRKLRARIARLPLARPSTRLEIFRRVSVAQDFLESNYPDSSLSLEVLAEHACLAPHHFLRSFKQVVGQTPHQYLLQLRLEKGRRLLSQGSFTVAQVAWLVGFESWEQFSRQFRRHFGTTPGAVRAAA